VTEVIAEVGVAVLQLQQAGLAYTITGDVYFDSAAAASASWTLGDESGLDRAAMLALSAERGGDPERPGKRDPLDPMLWIGAREGEPAWDSPVGMGRPGWHIECSVIAARHLAMPITVQGGGSDLIFPHHEFSAGHTAALTGSHLAAVYSHTGMVAFEGEKMSKSLGNLVLVSRLVAGGTDPAAIRLVLLAQHYRSDWEWTTALLADAEARLARWRAWAVGTSVESRGESDGEPSTLLERLREAISNDLDTAGAVAAIDAHIEAGTPASSTDLDAIDALLGIRL
jgi:L-cysteine:1D-myo-inositol 2-amino-2-deoxy-alpha-D-glucopyranoside ligase